MHAHMTPPPACTCVLTAAAQSTFTLSVFSLCHPRGLPDSCAHCSLATVSMIAHLALGLLLGIAHSIFPFQATELKPIIKINLWRKSSPPFLFWSLFSCERISSRSSDLWLSLQIHGTSTWELHEGSLHPLQSRHDLLCCGSGLIFWHSRATFPLVFQDRVTPNPGVEKLLSSQKTARPHSTKASVWIMAESKPVLEGSRERLLAPLLRLDWPPAVPWSEQDCCCCRAMPLLHLLTGGSRPCVFLQLVSGLSSSSTLLEASLRTTESLRLSTLPPLDVSVQARQQMRSYLPFANIPCSSILSAEAEQLQKARQLSCLLQQLMVYLMNQRLRECVGTEPRAIFLFQRRIPIVSSGPFGPVLPEENAGCQDSQS